MSLRILLAACLLLGAACGRWNPIPAEGFEVVVGLEMTVWASEPLLVNPTNFDVDERGRIWFIESVNYRSDLKDRPKNDEAGDRQVPGAQTMLTFNMGGSFTTCVAMVWGKT